MPKGIPKGGPAHDMYTSLVEEGWLDPDRGLSQEGSRGGVPGPVYAESLGIQGFRDPGTPGTLLSRSGPLLSRSGTDLLKT